ncbi:endonuclease 2 [Perilla frutescens var. frutescens]|nr:endonuclease 2 [Perilla frutescens var. frutescens]
MVVVKMVTKGQALNYIEHVVNEKTGLQTLDSREEPAFLRSFSHRLSRLAQPRLSKAAADAVSQLLPADTENDLGSSCSWPDRVKFRFHWSSSLHYLNTPDNLCTYQYNRICKDEDGRKDRCIAGAINNYTTELLSYRDSSPRYNLTEALKKDHSYP